jgi:hypothetical protein
MVAGTGGGLVEEIEVEQVTRQVETLESAAAFLFISYSGHLLLNPSLVMAICIFDDGKYISTVLLCKIPVQYICLERVHCFDV